MLVSTNRAMLNRVGVTTRAVPHSTRTSARDSGARPRRGTPRQRRSSLRASSRSSRVASGHGACPRRGSRA